MTEADTLINISVFEWTTAERLLAALRGIFDGDVDRALAELTNAYYTNVGSARVDPDNFRMGPPRGGQINSPQFCKAHPLRWSSDGPFGEGLVIHNEEEPHWVLVFSIKDAWHRWPAMKPSTAPDPEPVEPPVRGAPRKVPGVAQEAYRRIERGDVTLEDLRAKNREKRAKGFMTSIETMQEAMAIVEAAIAIRDATKREDDLGGTTPKERAEHFGISTKTYQDALALLAAENADKPEK
jgi:hypothetical protein